jgi:hypothetical protein
MLQKSNEVERAAAQRKQDSGRRQVEATTAEMEAYAKEEKVRLDFLNQQTQYLDELGKLDPRDPQYKTKRDSLCLKINLVSEALSGRPLEPSSVPPTIIPAPPGQQPEAYGAKKPLNQVQVITLLAGQVPSHRVAMLVHERGIDFEPQQEYLNEVRLSGGDDELIRALKSAKVSSPSAVR